MNPLKRRFRLYLGATALGLSLVAAVSAAAPQAPPTQGPAQSATEGAGPGTSGPDMKWTATKQLAAVELALVLVVLLGLPMLAHGRKNGDPKEIRGLGLPRGSVRSMLALLIVGSTINFFLFGSQVADDSFDQVVAALGTLSASVIGFYFGGRTATPAPKENGGGNTRQTQVAARNSHGDKSHEEPSSDPKSRTGSPPANNE